MPAGRAYHPTYEDCLDHQEALRIQVDFIINENKYISNDEERHFMSLLFGKATLGMCSPERGRFETIVEGKKISWPSLGYAIRRLLYWDGENDTELKGIQPKTIWGVVRNSLFVMFDPALKFAATKSPEYLPWSKERGDWV